MVTGSRVARSTFTTPNPVTVLNSKDIENLGLVNVGDVLGELPQNSNFFAANNVGLGNFNVGAQLANLRGLNPFFGTRTLTLVDTERVVPQATGGGVDVTLIPSMLVARTEVVTGGASAVYGSDAVAGVVNIILDKKLTGLKVQADYGQTSHHDGGDTHFSFGYGSDLRGPRPFHRRRRVRELRGHRHLLAGARLVQDQLRPCSRTPCTPGRRRGPTPAIPPNGLPHYIIGPNGDARQPEPDGRSDAVHRAGAACASRPGRNTTSIPPAPATSVFNPGNYADGAGVFGFSQGAGATGVGAYDGTTISPPPSATRAWRTWISRSTTTWTRSCRCPTRAASPPIPSPTAPSGPSRSRSASGVFVPLSSQISADNPYLPAQFQPGGANALVPSIPIPPPLCAPAPLRAATRSVARCWATT